MSEIRTVEVTAHRTPDGRPTCASDWHNNQICRFLVLRKLGCVEVCGLTGSDIDREHGDQGWLMPVAGCPVWAQK